MTEDVMTADLCQAEILLRRGYTVSAIQTGGYLCRPAAQLTPHETRCLRHIIALSGKLEVMPTVREIAASMDMKSLSAVHRLIERLELKGKLARVPQRKRGLVLLAGSHGGDETSVGAQEASSGTSLGVEPGKIVPPAGEARARRPLGLGWIS